MASIRKRGDSWRAEIAKDGVRRSATFATKAEAQAWANKVEHEIVSEKAGVIPDKTFADLLMKYIDEVSVTKRGARQERLKLERIASGVIGGVKLVDFDERHVYKWRDMRLTQVSSSSVSREWSTLSHACNIAYKEWKWLRSNPFSMVKRPADGKARTRRIANDEIEKILFSLGYSDDCTLETQTQRVGAMFLFAIETAMRAGEIVGLTWDNVAEKTAHLPMTKNGHARTVPLSSKARLILSRLPKDSASCFNVTSGNLDALFRKAKDKMMIDDLHFHDTRREALSRLSKKVDVMTLAKISGHRDLRILLNTYYAPDIEETADLLG
jgi:integrase